MIKVGKIIATNEELLGQGLIHVRNGDEICIVEEDKDNYKFYLKDKDPDLKFPYLIAKNLIQVTQTLPDTPYEEVELPLEQMEGVKLIIQGMKMMGWQVGVKDDEMVNGLIIGSEDYIDAILESKVEWINIMDEKPALYKWVIVCDDIFSSPVYIDDQTNYEKIKYWADLPSAYNTPKI